MAGATTGILLKIRLALHMILSSATCSSFNTTLQPILTDSLKFKFLIKAGGFWIGGRRQSLSSHWEWHGYTDTTPILYYDWSPGQPSIGSLSFEKNCLSLYYKSYSPTLQMGNGGCKVKVNFICEKDDSSSVSVIGWEYCRSRVIYYYCPNKRW